MGRKLGWHCESCDRGEVFHLGYGVNTLNPPECVAEAACGDQLILSHEIFFGDDPSIKMDVRMRGEHVRCPYCQRIYSATVAYVQDDAGTTSRHTIAPERCPHCNTVVDNKALGVRSLLEGVGRYVDVIWADGCLWCGGEVERIDQDGGEGA